MPLHLFGLLLHWQNPRPNWNDLATWVVRQCHWRLVLARRGENDLLEVEAVLRSREAMPAVAIKGVLVAKKEAGKVDSKGWKRRRQVAMEAGPWVCLSVSVLFQSTPNLS
jgi:hypothetical protein